MRKFLRFGLATALVCLTVSWAMAQTGIVMGTVTDDEGNPVDSALVTLSHGGGCGGGGHGGGGGGGGCHGGGGADSVWYSTFTGEDGTYIFPAVAPNTYLARARKMGFGMDSDSVTVAAGNTYVVDFILTGCGGGGGGCPHDTLEVIEVSGWAIVDTSFCRNAYFLDEDNDGVPEYRLQFGPPWYDPGSGATRPNNGDEIDIVGGLVDWTLMDMIVVYEINGLWWRDPVYPGGGHGGHGGGGGGHHGGGDVAVARPHIGGAFPNPFNPETTVRFVLPENGMVNLSVYNIRGEKVAQLVQGSLEAGEHSVTWNAAHLTSGVYLFRLEAGTVTSVKKVVFAK
jgi:hypothetical protein